MSCDDKLIPRTVYLLKRTDKEDDGTDLYVGSTSQPLPQRLKTHRHHSKISNSRVSRRMDEVGLQKWEIIPLVVVSSCGKIEILRFEQEWIALLNPDLNVLSSFRENNEGNRESARRHYLDSLGSKKYFCGLCEHAFGRSSGLKQHLRSQKHITEYMELDLD